MNRYTHVVKIWGGLGNQMFQYAFGVLLKFGNCFDIPTVKARLPTVVATKLIGERNSAPDS